jgi:uncharacterized protein YbjT (DUF2867 family)
MILVTGATGNAGSQVVRALRDRREDVRAFVRDADKARGLFGDDVELALGDFADPLAVRNAVDGVDAVFLSGADDPRRVEWEIDAIDAAGAAGVRRIVKLSSIVAEPGAQVAFWDWHGRIEQHLRTSGIPAVYLHSSFFMTNLLAAAGEVARGGPLCAPAGEARIAMIDPRDVGEAAAAVLTSEGHDGRTYVLTGPEATTHAQVAAELSLATGHEVPFVDVPGEDARQGMVQMGLPDFAAQQIVTIYALARQGIAEEVTATVESLTGRPPRDVAAFARDHAHLFALTAEVARR